MKLNRNLFGAAFRYLALAIVAAALCPAPARAQAGGTKFRVSSLGNDVIQVQASFEGTYTIEDGRLNINVTYGVMRMLARPQFQARTATVTALRFGIAHLIRPTANDKRTVTIDALGAAQPLDVVLTAGKDAPLTPYQTSVAIPPGTPLTDRWLTAQLTFPVTPEGSAWPGAILAHPRMGDYLAGAGAGTVAPAPPSAPRPPASGPPGAVDSYRPPPRTPAAPVDPAGGIPFQFSSVGSWFATQGEFSGFYYLQPDRVILKVNRAIISERADVKIRPERWTSKMQFWLSHATDAKKGEWTAATCSEFIPLDIHLLPGGREGLLPFQVAIPIKPGMVLRDHWVTVSLTDTVLEGAGGSSGSSGSSGDGYLSGSNGSPKAKDVGWCYVQSRHDLFR